MFSIKPTFYLTGIIICAIAITESFAAKEENHLTRFIKIGLQGAALNSQDHNQQLWGCVFDQLTGLTWEVKSQDSSWRNTDQTYSWFNPENNDNGGFKGYRNSGHCRSEICDTQAYIDHANRIQFCGMTNWRLPRREELRSIVDYTVPYPGPTINRIFFPHTRSQFYWSADADAEDPDSAWGIGFSFGFDYAYFKNDLGHVRLVNDTKGGVK